MLSSAKKTAQQLTSLLLPVVVAQEALLPEFGAVLTTVLSVLFKYCYKYYYRDSRKL
jgi:hypothetical protein